MLFKLIAFIGTLIFLGCSGMKVQTDYDPSVTLTDYKSFAIVHKKQEHEDTLTNGRIENALIQTFQSKNYENVPRESADFYVVYHVNVENKTRIDTEYQSLGFYRYSGMMIASTRTVEYDQGQLIVDVMDPKTQKILWRGMATDQLYDLDTPQERTEYINKVISKILESFPAHP